MCIRDRLGIIMGDVAPDAGVVEKGDTVKIGYFSQENQVLDEDARVIRFISDIAGTVKTAEGSLSASQMLERFLFPPHMHSVKIGKLSGGEKRRLYLLSILMQAPNEMCIRDRIMIMAVGLLYLCIIFSKICCKK